MRWLMPHDMNGLPESLEHGICIRLHSHRLVGLHLGTIRRYDALAAVLGVAFANVKKVGIFVQPLDKVALMGVRRLAHVEA